MISLKQIKDEVSKKNSVLYKTFLPDYKYNFDFKKIKKFKKFKTVIVIGMGGSILGAKAIYSFLNHKIKKKFIFIDNLDQTLLNKTKKENNLSQCLYLIISKSGNTSETIVNANYFKFFLKKTNVIIISENKNNILSRFAKSNGFTFVAHKTNIGGRYSIFSESGMLPAYLMGLEPKKFKKNLKKFLNNKKLLSNSLKEISKFKNKQFKILILFNYIPELNDFLFWCQQLLAESLGKNKKGFLPFVSPAPKDHHSLLQLYLDGPKDKIFYVFNFSTQKGFQNLKVAQKNAFIEVLKKNKNFFREINIKKFDEDTLGKLFLLFIFETIALGKMTNTNPFGQPAVEQVKILTKKFLKSKKLSKKYF